MTVFTDRLRSIPLSITRAVAFPMIGKEPADLADLRKAVELLPAGPVNLADRVTAAEQGGFGVRPRLKAAAGPLSEEDLQQVNKQLGFRRPGNLALPSCGYPPSGATASISASVRAVAPRWANANSRPAAPA
ncbi:MAG: hypothetical protein HYS20_15040 [Rhodocyclales bacterium]|nr:hypothetical protein [Rhodocyclales bacterium]